MGVEPIGFEDWGWGGVAIQSVHPLRFAFVEEGDITEDSAGGGVDADGMEFDAIEQCERLIAGIGFKAACGIGGICG